MLIMRETSDDLYIGDLMYLQWDMMKFARDEFPGLDERWFITEWMRSDIRRAMDHLNPYWLAKTETELLYAFMEGYTDYPKSDDALYDVGEWIMGMYGLFQRTYALSSKRIIELLPVSYMEQAFFPLHETDMLSACIKIHDLKLNLEPKQPDSGGTVYYECPENYVDE